VTLLGTAGSKRNASPLYRYVILRVLAPMVPDKENQERVVPESGLDWVLVRPPRFVNGQGRPPRGLRAGARGRVGHVRRGRPSATFRTARLYERIFLGLELLWIALAAGYIATKRPPANRPA
jgi:NAD(P)H-binding